MLSAAEREPGGSTRQFLVWFSVLTLLTGGSVVWLRYEHVNIFEGFAWQEILIGYSPLLAALAAIALWRGRGATTLGMSLVNWRVGARWYVLVIAFPFLLMLLAHLFVRVAQGDGLHWPAAYWLAPLHSVGSLLSGSIGEELGWRGFALPLLSRRIGVLRASIILGVIWGVWHMNAELTTSHPLDAFLLGVPKGLLRMVATAVLYGWLYAKTGGSLPVVMLAHAGHNIAVAVLPFADTAPEGGFPLWVISALYALAALPVAWLLWRAERRSSGAGGARATSYE